MSAQDSAVDTEVKYLTVGGGIAGIAFCGFLPKGSDYLLLERENECGGWSRTVKQDGFTWDYAGHFFHFRQPKVREYMEDKLKQQGDDGELIRVRKITSILYKDSLIDFPFQANIHQLPKEDFIDCLYSLYFRDEEAKGGDGEEEDSFERMLYGKFGRGITEKFLKPYNEKLYATPLTRLDRDAMSRFFPHVDLDGIIRSMKQRPEDSLSYNTYFTYPRGGAATYVNALLADLDPKRVALEESLVAIDLEARVATTNKRKIKYENLVTSIPFNQLLKIASVPHDPEIYTYNKVLVFNLGFDRAALHKEHWLYVPDPELCFYRVGWFSNVFGDERMSLYVEIGYPSDAEVDADAMLPRVLEDLKKAGIVTDHELVSHMNVMLSPAYVHINTKSREDFKEKHAYLRERGVHSIGRYGLWEYASVEDGVVEAYALAHEILDRKEENPFTESKLRYFEISGCKKQPRIAGMGPLKLKE